MKKRIFIAINLSEEIRQELRKLLSRIKKSNSDLSIKWLESEQMHLTLHFLGYLTENQIEKVKKIIEAKIKDLKTKVKDLKLKITQISTFPSLDRFRVVFFRVEEDRRDVLKKFQRDLGRDLKRNGFKIDQRLWQPHITLGRNKSIGNQQLTVDNLELKNLSFRIKSIDLMKSKLEKKGARYSILTKYYL